MCKTIEEMFKAVSVLTFEFHKMTSDATKMTNDLKAIIKCLRVFNSESSDFGKMLIELKNLIEELKVFANDLSLILIDLKWKRSLKVNNKNDK